MREIKFRAWDIKEKIFIEFGPLYGLQSLISEGRHADSGYLLMQFTGLKDRNGKEIYEGDVVEIQNNNCQIQKASIVGTVVFNFASFGVKINKVSQWKGYNIDAPRRNDFLWLLNIALTKEFTVIGNIHENPDLVTQNG